MSASRALWLVVLSGCGLVLDLEPSWDGGRKLDGSRTLDGGQEPDAGQTDARAVADAGAEGACGLRPLTGELLAFYTFDRDLNDSLDTGPTGVAVPPYRLDDIGTDCGAALTFYPPAEPGAGYVYLAASDLWNQAEASIDLMLRLDAHAGSNTGVLSRDAMGALEGGHTTLVVTETGQLAVRMQVADGDRHSLCSDAPIPLGEWIHVGLQVGSSSRLFIDGVQQSFTGTLSGGPGMPVIECMGPEVADRSLDGNDEPWVIGALSWNSTTGSPTPATGPLVGAVDHLRFWRGIVDFSAR